jgi:hypothetical protein
VITREQRGARSILAMVAASLLVTSLAAQAPEPGITFAADVPLVERDGVPCVEAKIGDGPGMLFGIDTGNVDTSVDSKAAKAAGLSLSAMASPWPAGSYQAVIPELRVGGVVLRGTHALVMDFASNQMPTDVAGTIAYTAFKDRIVQIDYTAHRLRISAVLTGHVSLTEPRDSFSLVTFGREGPPVVVARGFELGGRPVTAQVDTMYTGSMLIYSASIGRLCLGPLAKGVATEFFALTDGGVNMKVAVAPAETYHGIRLGAVNAKVYFPTPGVHEPDGLFDATVGVALLKEAVLTLDFHGGMVSMSRPALPAPIDGTNVPRDRIPRDLIPLVE